MTVCHKPTISSNCKEDYTQVPKSATFLLTEKTQHLELGWARLVEEMRLARWWFQIFFMFTPFWGNDPISQYF